MTADHVVATCAVIMSIHPKAPRPADKDLWLPAAFVLAVAVSAVNAWVLLVEVLR